MQCEKRSESSELNARDASPAVNRTEHARLARRFWLGEARRSIRFARGWRQRFGGPLHATALGFYLESLLDAETYRSWARDVGGTR